MTGVQQVVNLVQVAGVLMASILLWLYARAMTPILEACLDNVARRTCPLTPVRRCTGHLVRNIVLKSALPLMPAAGWKPIEVRVILI